MMYKSRYRSLIDNAFHETNEIVNQLHHRPYTSGGLEASVLPNSTKSLLTPRCESISQQPLRQPVDAMNFSSDFSLCDEYQSFRSTVPLKRVAVDSDPSKMWKIFDAGPKNVHTPLVFLPPVVGTADVYFRQLLALSTRGIRAISVEPSVYWSVEEWCAGFQRLLDHLDIDKVHLFGASLGGYLAQKFAEYTSQYSRVASLILCNSFMETSIFNLSESATLFWMMPNLVLKKMVVGNLRTNMKDLSILRTIDFMTERLETLSQPDIASRLTINCVKSYVDVFQLRNVTITLLDVFDESALSSLARDAMYKSYPHAKMAHLKTGGNFPYLSRSDEVNMHILIHLRAFNDSRLSAQNKLSEVNNTGETSQQSAIATQ